MSRERIVVIGADAAGMSVAHQALRTARWNDREVEIVALEATGHTSYSACGIPYWIAGDVDTGDDLVARTAEEHRAAGIDLRTGVIASGLDLEARTVTVRNGDGSTGTVDYDQLVIATGAHAIIPGWARRDDGALYDGVGPVKDLDDGEAWLRRFTRTFDAVGSSARVVIAGGGYIGVEMAETALRRGFGVTVVTRSRVMSSFDPDMSERIAAAMRLAGVRLVENATVEGLTVGQDGWVHEVTADDGTTYDCDLAVLAMGILPSTGFAEEAGLPTGQQGDLCADDTGLVVPGVWAAGDCCEVRHRLTGERVFLPLGTHATKQGRVVGTNVGGGDVRFEGVLGTAITRFVHGDVHLEIARTGLGERDAAGAGLDAAALVTEGTTASGYMPEAEPIAVKVVAERGSRRLLGMQIVGGPGSAKRIDTAATALWAGLTVDDVAAMDLSYSPPFATTWEIVQVAVRRLADRMDRDGAGTTG